MKYSIYIFNIWSKPIKSISIDQRYVVKKIGEDTMGIFINHPNKPLIKFKVNGSDYQAHFITNNHLVLPKSLNNVPFISTEKMYDLDKPILFTDRKNNAFCAVSQWDNINLGTSKKPRIFEVIQIRPSSYYRNSSEYQDKFVLTLSKGERNNGKA